MTSATASSAVLLLAMLAGASRDDEPYFEGLPRVRWAPKLPGGTIKLLSIGGYISLHDTHELAQRFDVAARCLATTHYSDSDKPFGITGDSWPELLADRDQILDEVREAIAGEWDVLALGSAPGWRAYPEDLRRSIIAAVAAGRSLMVSIGKELEEDFAAAGAPLAKVEFDAGRFADDDSSDPPRLHRCGRGWIMHWLVKASPQSFQFIFPSGGLSDFEYRAARAGWYLLRAARPGAGAAIRSLKVAGDVITLDTTADPVLCDAQLEVAVRRREAIDGPVTFERHFLREARKASPGASFQVQLPKLPAGRYQAEVLIRDRDDRTLDWDIARFEVQGSVQLQQVMLDRKTVAPGDRLTCRLKTQGPVKGASVLVRWYDHWGRLLSEKSVGDAGESFSVAVPGGSLSVINHVQVTLAPTGGPEAVAAAEVLMPDNVRPDDDFSVLYWRTGAEGHVAWQWDALRRRGAADGFCNTGTSEGVARDAANHHLRVVPYTTSFHAMALAPLIVDEEAMKRTEESARQTARDQRPYNDIAYTLGDENYISGFDEAGRFLDHPKLWVKFRAFLREMYPSIDALNAQWESKFSDFDSIRFESETKMLGSADNPSAWVDFRFFVERAWAKIHERMRDAIRQEHPGAIVGFDGAEQYSSYDGFDWWQLAREMDMVNVYHHYFLPGRYANKMFNGHAAQSFAGRARMKACWMNGADLRYGGEYVPWYLALNGWNSVWWWYATFLHPANGALQWDMQLTPVAAGMARAALEIKSGPATLLAHAEKQYDPIAVHYSSANWHASTIESGIGDHVNNLGLGADLWMADSLTRNPQQKALWGQVVPKGHCAAASKSFYVMLHDMGFKPRTVARQDIEDGALVRGSFKVLVLPFVVALSEDEAESIRAFVKAGGLLVADYRCGLRDGHCRVRKAGALDDVFGITRVDTNVRRKPGAVSMYLTDTGRGAQFDGTFHEAIQAAGAAVYGVHEDGVGAFFVNHAFGAGKAIYLNSDIYEYLHMRKKSHESDLRELIRNALTSLDGTRGAFVRAPFAPEHEGGHCLGRTEVTRFRDGSTRYFGVLPDHAVDDEVPRPASLPFPTGTHVYDVRAGRYLGKGGRTGVLLRPGRAEMYAAVAYEIAGITVRGPEEARRGEPVEIGLQVETSSGIPGPHAARVRVVRPDGKAAEYHSRTLYLPQGKGSIAFTLALNEPTGTWKIEAAECISGKRSCRELRIIPESGRPESVGRR